MNIELPEFETARVLVAGDVMLDRYWHGPASRISPEAPVPVVRVTDVEERPGGAGNVALNIAALGAKAALLGLTGNDEAADILQDRLEQSAVDCYFERLAGQPTVTKLRVLSRHQQLIRLDFETGFADHDPRIFTELVQRHLENANVVVLSDYGKGTLRNVQELVALVRAAGKPVLVDPKGVDYTTYRGATVITPNLAEFESVVGSCADDEMLASKGEALRQELELEALLITRSERGMSLLQRGHEPIHLGTRAREVYDVTGAGDTVISVLAAALAAGQDLAHAMAVANLAAGLVVGKLGTAAISVPELRRAIRELDQDKRGVMSLSELQVAVQDAQAHGERVVMTNGCFDILHAGHVHYLEKARRLGDRLIVAVNDDASVTRLKGPKRPINGLEHRMSVLASLQQVDWVVPFSEDTPAELICGLRPDVLVKGGDYRPEQIAGADCVQANGGDVVVLDYVEGLSTSSIIDALQTD